MHAQPYVLLNDVLVENLFYKFYTCKVSLQYVLSNDVLRRQNLQTLGYTVYRYTSSLALSGTNTTNLHLKV